VGVIRTNSSTKPERRNRSKLLYCLIKIVVGASALVMSYEYFFYMVEFPSQKYYYIGDIVGWFLFSAIIIGEALIQITEI